MTSCVSFLFKKKKKHYFCLCWVFVAARGLSLVMVHGLLTAVASLVGRARVLRCTGSVVVVYGLALQHVGSSWTRSGTHHPCIGRQSLNHWTTREVHIF